MHEDANFISPHLTTGGRELLDMKLLREEMQARRLAALNKLESLHDVEQTFMELSK